MRWEAWLQSLPSQCCSAWQRSQGRQWWGLSTAKAAGPGSTVWALCLLTSAHRCSHRLDISEDQDTAQEEAVLPSFPHCFGILVKRHSCLIHWEFSQQNYIWNPSPKYLILKCSEKLEEKNARHCKLWKTFDSLTIECTLMLYFREWSWVFNIPHLIRFKILEWSITRTRSTKAVRLIQVATQHIGRGDFLHVYLWFARCISESQITISQTQIQIKYRYLNSGQEDLSTLQNLPLELMQILSIG